VGSPSEARTILVIVICLLFEICDLEFLVTTADCLKWVKTIEAPQAAAQSRILYLLKRIKYEATISPGNA
jgi:hypothetical protein